VTNQAPRSCAARLPRRLRVGVACVAVAGLSGCATYRPVPYDTGIPRCPVSAATDLLSVDALQCWFDAGHGPWRVLSHESHFDVLVVQISALDLRDADEVARRVVAGERQTFSEILVYAVEEVPLVPARVRRVRWTRDAGFEALEFRSSGGR